MWVYSWLKNYPLTYLSSNHSSDFFSSKILNSLGIQVPVRNSDREFGNTDDIPGSDNSVTSESEEEEEDGIEEEGIEEERATNPNSRSPEIHFENLTLSDPEDNSPSTVNKVMPNVTFHILPELPHAMGTLQKHTVLAIIIQLEGNTDVSTLDIALLMSTKQKLKFTWEEEISVTRADNILRIMVEEEDGQKKRYVFSNTITSIVQNHLNKK